jgi:hypothetical protein
VSFTFVYAWELGGGLGHVSIFRPLAQALQEQGHRVVSVVQSVAAAKSVGLSEVLEIPKRFAYPQRSMGHAGILQTNAGFHDASNLLSTVNNWLAIFRSTGANMVLCDYAPAARLAARIAKLPTVALDTGFFTPPLGQPLPLFRGQTPELLGLRAQEKAVMDCANDVLKHFKAPLLTDCAELLHTEHQLFAHHGALDAYNRPDKTGFVGPFISIPAPADAAVPTPLGPAASSQAASTQTAPAQQSASLNAPIATPPRSAFAYLTAQFPLTVGCMQALLDAGIALTAYIANAKADPKVQALADAGHMTLLAEPADMHSILPSIDMVVCHAGVGTINQALAYGKPLLLVPTFAEQAFNAQRVCAHGLGSMVQLGLGEQPAVVVEQFLHQLPTITRACQQFARDNPLGDPQAAARTLSAWAQQANATQAPATQAKAAPTKASEAKAKANVKANTKTNTTKTKAQPTKPASAAKASTPPPQASLRFKDLDVIFLSYDEPNADAHFALLQQLAPQAKRVHGVKGFDAAHKAAAQAASTERFITVDADTQALPAFFNTEVAIPSHIHKSTWSWSSVNDVNGLCYGNGGLKIWHKDMIGTLVSHEQAKGALAYDFCHHAGYSQFDTCYSSTHPNGSARQAFRAGLREVVKLGRNDKGEPIPPHLVAKLMGQLNMRRLLIWMTAGADSLHGDWMLLGARTGFWLNTQKDFNPDTVTDFSRFAELWDKDYAHMATQAHGAADANTDADAGVNAAVQELGERIRRDLDFSLLQDWDTPRSQAFKAQMAQRRPQLGVFEVNHALL